MATKTPFVVYVLPIILSVGLGTLVMAEALNDSDRTLNMWQFDKIGGASDTTSEAMKIIGLQSKYAVSETIELEIQIFDKAFNCGDLYITIYEISDSTKEVITQSGFLNQCYGSVNNYLPIDQEYSEILTEKGEYEILVEIYNTTYKQTNSLIANIIVN